MADEKVSAIIPAAGLGVRFSNDIRKQFYTYKGTAVLELTIASLKNAYPFHEYIIGAMPEDYAKVENIANKLGIEYRISKGGNKRFDTVLSAVNMASGDFIAVHDAVRPFVTPEVVITTVELGIKTGGAICGLFAIDTVKKVENSLILDTLDRSKVFLAHTPQVFLKEKFKTAMLKAQNSGNDFTDDSSIFEYAGFEVNICASDIRNIKITSIKDID
jgi:2-C-methyl-D-erythritol 4-phosphate cytidylyltransferase